LAYYWIIFLIWEYIAFQVTIHNKTLRALLGIALLSALAFHSLSPAHVAKNSTSSFSIPSVQKHIEVMATEPHFMGSEAKTKVRDYIVAEFDKMGLKATVENHYL
jgi:hypothetical protein